MASFLALIRMKNLVLVLAATIGCFFLGGGWKFFSGEEMYGLWHNVHSDWEYSCTYFSMFTELGIAQAISGLLWSIIILRSWPIRRQLLWLWAFLLVSLVCGGYKFFLLSGEYINAPLARLDYLPVPATLLWFLPFAFLVNGGGVGLLAGILVAVIQNLIRQRNKPSPNQAP